MWTCRFHWNEPHRLWVLSPPLGRRSFIIQTLIQNLNNLWRDDKLLWWNQYLLQIKSNLLVFLEKIKRQCHNWQNRHDAHFLDELAWRTVTPVFSTAWNLGIDNRSWRTLFDAIPYYIFSAQVSNFLDLQIQIINKVKYDNNLGRPRHVNRLIYPTSAAASLDNGVIFIEWIIASVTSVTLVGLRLHQKRTLKNTKNLLCCLIGFLLLQLPSTKSQESDKTNCNKRAVHFFVLTNLSSKMWNFGYPICH